ncbi:MAG: hypothetical protein MR216_01880 [Bacteroidales bacterium]|nr:hypothetical protein [Bacteroidales bacterium]
MNIEEIEDLRSKLQASCDLLVNSIGPIQIGKESQFPYGWRKAAKGRTVWRIVEEVITQNLEKYHSKFEIDNVIPSDSEVSVYDMVCKFAEEEVFINIKSAVEGGKRQKDDISKASGLLDFYNEDAERQFFVATFYIRFNKNMTIELTKSVVFPVAWIPDIYVNPSNNGNLQSAYYKDVKDAIKRTNEEFIPLLKEAYEVALEKKNKKMI